MSKDKYIKESDLFKSMENNSHMVEVFGKQRKMIDGMLLTYDIAEFERLNIEEIRAKAIDEFVSRLEKHTQENWIDHQEYGITWSDIEQIAKQMKGDMQ